MMAEDDQAHQLPEPPGWRAGRPRQPGPGHLVIDADRSPAAAAPQRRRLMIQRLDLRQLRLPVRRGLPHVMNQGGIASQRTSAERLREPLGQDSRALQMINQRMARAARMTARYAPTGMMPLNPAASRRHPKRLSRSSARGCSTLKWTVSAAGRRPAGNAVAWPVNPQADIGDVGFAVTPFQAVRVDPTGGVIAGRVSSGKAPIRRSVRLVT